MPGTYHALGINLRSYPLGDQDKIVLIYTREYGKIRCVAKGAKKISSKFTGRLEPMQCNQLFLAKGRNLDILTQIKTEEHFSDLWKKPERLWMGSLWLSWINRLTEDRYADSYMFDLLFHSLKELQTVTDESVLSSQLQSELMRHQGVGAVLSFQQFMTEYAHP